MANFDLSKLMEGRNPQQVMLAETRQLKSKWEKTGLLEGLKEREQHSMAVLLENQAKQLLDEATQTGTGNASGGSEEWSGVALPLVRRIFGEIAAKEFVSVQPMNLPSGLVFFLDFKYGTSQAGQPGFNGKSLFGGNGGSAANDADFGRTDAAVNGLYGNGRYGFSINDTETSAVTIAHTTGIVSASWSEIGFDGALSASCAAGQIVKLTVPAASFTRPDANGISAFVVSGSEASNPYHKPAAGEITNFGQFAYVSGTNYIFFVSASAGAGYRC